MTTGDLVAMGIEAPPPDPNVACAAQTHDGYAAFDTIAKGRWSAFGWCSSEPPNMERCAFPIPPRWLCILPARPAFESVIRDQCIWEDFWAAHVFTPSAPPVIDFEQYLVIAVVLGEREVCGWDVNIDSIHLTPSGATISISECLLLGGEKRLNNPFHFVVLSKSCILFGHTVCFDHCSGPEPI